jgi:hypothetical protein
MMIDKKRGRELFVAYILYLAFFSVYFLIIAPNGNEWLSIWLHDRAYVFLLSTAFLILCAQTDKYYHAATYIRIGSGKKIVVGRLLTEYGLAAMMVNLLFLVIILGLLVKYKELSGGGTGDIFDWYGRYMLGLFLTASVSLTLRYSAIRPLRSFSYILTLLLLIADLFVVTKTLSRFSSLNGGLLFSWVFARNTLLSYIVLLMINAILAVRLTIIIDKRDLTA